MTTTCATGSTLVDCGAGAILDRRMRSVTCQSSFLTLLTRGMSTIFTVSMFTVEDVVLLTGGDDFSDLAKRFEALKSGRK